jgi:hypothetical protein
MVAGGSVIVLLSSHEWREGTLQWQNGTSLTDDGFLIASSKFHLFAD